MHTRHSLVLSRGQFNETFTSVIKSEAIVSEVENRSYTCKSFIKWAVFTLRHRGHVGGQEQ